MAKNDFQCDGWNSYTLQCGTIMTLISPGDCTLQCGMWLWNYDSEFTKWQHPAMWQVVLGWHVIAILPNVRHIGILHLVSILTISPQSTCHSAPVCEIISKSDRPRQKKNDVMSIFKMADLRHLGFRGPIMGSLKSPCTTFCRSSIATIIKVKVWTLAIAPLTWVRLVTSSALQSRKWQLIGTVTSPILYQLDHCTHVVKTSLYTLGTLGL